MTKHPVARRYARRIAARLDDEQLVDAARRGDRAALDQLLRRHYERIHAVCRRIAGDRGDADDACQEAMIKIVRSLPRFDGRSSFGTWAYRVATNAALDELRRRRRRPHLRAVADDHLDEAPDPGAARRAGAVEDRLVLDEALDGLAEDFRVAVVLRDVADLDYGEIAEVLDVPIGTVKSRIARGRRALADALRIDELPPLPRDGDPAPGPGDPARRRGSGNRDAVSARPTVSDTPPGAPVDTSTDGTPDVGPDADTDPPQSRST